MKDKIIKILLINLLFLTLALRILSDDDLIPQKKPIISEKILEKTKISNFLIPPKKPNQNDENEIQQTDQKKNTIKRLTILL